MCAPSAIEQLNAEILVKRFDLETHRRLRKIQLFGSLPEGRINVQKSRVFVHLIGGE
jgi:hypothetical protein